MFAPPGIDWNFARRLTISSKINRLWGWLSSARDLRTTLLIILNFGYKQFEPAGCLDDCLRLQ
jgi:hypothetical protein